MRPFSQPDEASLRLLASLVEGQNLVISGATGFVGKSILNLLERLSEQFQTNFSLLTTSRTSPLDLTRQSRINHVHFRSDERELPALLESWGATHFMHLATPTTRETGAEDFSLVSQSTLGVLQIFIDLLGRSNDVRVLNASSGAVYGPREAGETPIPIGAPFNLAPWSDPIKDHYTNVKRESELLISKATSAGKILGTNARLFAFMGPGLALNSHFAIGNFIRDCVARKSISIMGNPDTTRAYLPSEMMAATLLEATFGEFFELCHISGSNSYSLFQYANMLGELSDLEVLIGAARHSKPDFYVGEQDFRFVTSTKFETIEYLSYWLSIENLRNSN